VVKRRRPARVRADSAGRQLALSLLLPAQEGSSRADGRPGPGQPARSGAGSRYNVVGRLYNDLEGIP
jgi:hypothetical protein